MSILLDALKWLTVPAHWLGESGILMRAAQHLGLTLLIVALAALIALPLGTWIGHTGRGRWLVSATGAARGALAELGALFSKQDGVVAHVSILRFSGPASVSAE